MSDIAVIGGGIAGVAAAAALAPHADVALFEAEDALGYHASGRSAAMFLEDYGNDTVRALNRASAPTHKALGVLAPRDMLLVARETEKEAFTAEHRAFAMTPIGVAEAQALWPILNPRTTAHAALRRDVCDLDTDLLLQSFRRVAARHGAAIHTGAPVSEIARDGDAWRITAGHTSHRAGRIVNAAGAWADRVATMAGIAPLGLQPYRRSMARLPAPGGHDVRGWPFVDSVRERWYAKPDAGAWLVSPSEEDPADPHDAWADDMVLAEGLARYEEMVTEPVTRMVANWAGLRTFAPDRTLVIGPDPDRGDFLWLAGQGGYGFQTAPAAAALLADLALGRRPELDAAHVQALAPGRLRR